MTLCAEAGWPLPVRVVLNDEQDRLVRQLQLLPHAPKLVWHCLDEREAMVRGVEFLAVESDVSLLADSYRDLVLLVRGSDRGVRTYDNEEFHDASRARAQRCCEGTSIDQCVPLASETRAAA